MKLFDRLFKKQNTRSGVAMVHENTGSFSMWTGDAYANDVFRGAVDAIARNCGKLKGSVVVNYSDHKEIVEGSKLNRLLQNRPNPYMNAYDFLYKMVTRLYIYNNAFALLDRDEAGNVQAIYPITSASCEMLSDEHNNLYTRFVLPSGKIVTFDYRDVIHLRRCFNDSELFGSDNSALYPALELAHTQNEGIISGIKAGANIRGLLKFTQIMAPGKLQEEKNAFINDFLQMGNDGGIIALDQKADYIPLESKPVLLSAEQAGQIENKIYSYLGISKAIVDSSYSEDVFSAFYESVVEPIALALGLEFTTKVFTERQQAYGNAITFESGRLAFTSNKTKVELLKEIMPLGLVTVNQALEILNLPAVSDGDRRIQSLNYVDQSKATEYQLSKVGKDNRLKGDTE